VLTCIQASFCRKRPRIEGTNRNKSPLQREKRAQGSCDMKSTPSSLDIYIYVLIRMNTKVAEWHKWPTCECVMSHMRTTVRVEARDAADVADAARDTARDAARDAGADARGRCRKCVFDVDFKEWGMNDDDDQLAVLADR